MRENVQVSDVTPYVTLYAEAQNNLEIRWDNPPVKVRRSDIVEFLKTQDKNLGDLSKIRVYNWGSELLDGQELELIPGENLITLETMEATSNTVGRIEVFCGGDHFFIKSATTMTIQEILDYAKTRSNPIDAGGTTTTVKLGGSANFITNRKAEVSPGQQVEIQIATDGKA